MDSNQLFNSFLTEVQNEVSPNTFSIWFSKLELININDNVISIKIPMEIHRKMLTDNYFNLIESTFFSLTGSNYNFNFLLEEEMEEFLEPEPTITEKITLINDDILWESNLLNNLTFDNYIVGNSNRLAFIAAKAVSENPGTIHNPLFIYGKSGLGKTHLLHAIGNEITKNSNKKVLYTTSNEFMTDYTGIINIQKGKVDLDYANNFKDKYRNIDVLLVDDIQFLVGAERTQQEFFHTFNTLHQSNKQIIITSDRSPDDLKKLEERLRSRFMWGLPVDIFPPDFELRCNIIKSKIKNTILEKIIDDDVIEYIANNCENDVRHIEGTINRLMAYTAMMVPSKITLEFAIEALKDYLNKNIYSSNSVENILNKVAEYFKVTVSDIKSKKRTNKIVRPRHIAMYLARTETDESLSKIGLEFGGRDHSTVIAASEKIKKEMISDDLIKKMLKDIKEML